MSFDFDIFISYAHLDNEPLVQDERGWITDFHYVLERRLAMLLGEQPRIWRDPELRGNDYFDDTIADGLHRSALLVSVITPRYLRSDYCQRELHTFSAQAESWDRLSGSRIFKVVKTPVQLEALPPQLRAVLGYEFYELDVDRNKTREYSLSPSYREPFITVVDDLAQEIVAALGTLRAALGGAENTTPQKANGTKVVYLAPTTSDLRAVHDALRRELLERGHAVLPDRQLPMIADAVTAAVRAHLEKADLSIHLLGEKYGFIPEDATVSSIEMQLDIAAELCDQRGLPRIFWLPPGLELDDPRQQALVARIERGADSLRHAQVMKTSVEELKGAVRAQLEPPPDRAPPRAQSSPADDGDPLWLYLIHTEEDGEEIGALEDGLWDAGFEVRTPLFDVEDETELRAEHEENLRLCDVFLIYYGHGTERWQRKLLGDLKKARGLGRDKKILHKAVVLGAPSSPAKKRYRTREAQVIEASAPLGTEVLRPLLEEVARKTREDTG